MFLLLVIRSNLNPTHDPLYFISNLIRDDDQEEDEAEGEKEDYPDEDPKIQVLGHLSLSQ